MGSTKVDKSQPLAPYILSATFFGPTATLSWWIKPAKSERTKQFAPDPGLAFNNQLLLIFYLSTGSRNLVDYICKHNVLVVGLDTDFLPLHVLSQTHIVTLERMSDASSIRCLSVAKYNAGRNLFSHSISSGLIKRSPIAIATPPVEYLTQQLRRLGQKVWSDHPVGAKGTAAVRRKAKGQGTEKLSPLS